MQIPLKDGAFRMQAMPCIVLKTPSPNCVDTYPNTDKSLLFKRPVIGAAKSDEYVRLESESLASFSSSFSTRTSSSSLIHLTPLSPCFQRTTAPLQDASYLAFAIFRRLPLFGPLHPILAPSYGKHRQQQCLCSHRYRHDLPYDGPEACFYLCRQNLCQRCRCQGGSEVAPGELFFFNPRCWRADEPVTRLITLLSSLEQECHYRFHRHWCGCHVPSRQGCPRCRR